MKFRSKSKAYKIDKSVLTFGEPLRVRDRKYLDSYAKDVCDVPGCNLPAVGCHIRYRFHAGGMKPGDDLTWPFCSLHNGEMDTWGDLADWFMVRVIMPKAQERYRRWKAISRR